MAAVWARSPQGKLRVGSDIPYPPFEFGRPPDYEGFDVDIVNEIAKRLDLEARFVKTPFDPIFRNLAQGQVRHGRLRRADHAGARGDRGLLGSVLPGRPIA